MRTTGTTTAADLEPIRAALTTATGEVWEVVGTECGGSPFLWCSLGGGWECSYKDGAAHIIDMRDETEDSPRDASFPGGADIPSAVAAVRKAIAAAQ